MSQNNPHYEAYQNYDTQGKKDPANLPKLDKYYVPIFWNTLFKPKHNVVLVIRKHEVLVELEKNMKQNES